MKNTSSSIVAVALGASLTACGGGDNTHAVEATAPTISSEKAQPFNTSTKVALDVQNATAVTLDDCTPGVQGSLTRGAAGKYSLTLTVPSGTSIEQKVACGITAKNATATTTAQVEGVADNVAPEFTTRRFPQAVDGVIPAFLPSGSMTLDPVVDKYLKSDVIVGSDGKSVSNVSYNPDTGILTWNQHPVGTFNYTRLATDMAGNTADQSIILEVRHAVDNPLIVKVDPNKITQNSIEVTCDASDADGMSGTTTCSVLDANGNVIHSWAPNGAYLVPGLKSGTTYRIRIEGVNVNVDRDTGAKNYVPFSQESAPITTLPEAVAPTGPSLSDVGPLLDRGGNTISFNLNALSGLPVGSAVVAVTEFPSVDEFGTPTNLTCNSAGECTMIYDIANTIGSKKTFPVAVEVRVPGYSTTLVRPQNIIIENEA